MKWLLFALGASMVAAGGGDDDDDDVKTHPMPVQPEYKTEKYTETKVHKETEYHKATETVKVPEYHENTETVKIPEPYGVTETVKVPEPYAVTDTEYQDVPTTIYQTIATTFYEDVPTTQVQQVRTTVVQDVPTTVYVTDVLTSLTTEPAVTVFITSTTVDTLPPVTITTTTSQCEFCKIDIYAKALAFPTSYIYTTVWPTTYRVQKTVYEDINSTAYSTSTIFAQTTCIETPETTWEYSGVILTSPTTYLAYTDISRGFLEPRPTVYGCGELVFEPLELGPAATDLNELVIATTAIPTGPTGAPLQLLNYLDTLPTVVQQLDGVPASSCDLPSISSVEPLAPQETAKLATTTQGFIFQFAPVVRALANVATGGAATATATSSA